MKKDKVIFDLIEKEKHRQQSGIELIASENFVSDQVMTCPASLDGTITERMVAANKQLILRVLKPGVPLIAAKLSFDGFLPDGAAFQMRLDSHLGTRIFKSSLLRDNQKIGEFVYYGR